jgi:serralysin
MTGVQLRWETPMTENNVLALLSGSRWSSSSVGYFFADSPTDYPYWNSITFGFQPVGSAHQQAVRAILQGARPAPSSGPYMTLSSVTDVTNLNVVSTGETRSEIAIAQSSNLERSMAYYPDQTWGNVLRAGDVWLSGAITDAQLGTFEYYTIMHELGHALGLKHGHEQDDTNNPAVLSADRDSIEFSVMTYRTYVGDTDLDHFSGANTPYTLMMYDIAALQNLYGANFSTNNTDTVYTWTLSGRTYVNGVEAGSGSSIFMTVWDGGGNDTYDFSNFDEEMTIDLSPGAWSSVSSSQLAYLGDGHVARGNVFNALQYQRDPRSLIENAIGGDLSDKITGNSAGNRLIGRFGDDTLRGGAGDDTLEGGGDNDWLDGGTGSDVLKGGDGWDNVSYVSATFAVMIDLSNNDNRAAAEGDVLVGIESVQGTMFKDQLASRPEGAYLFGEAGDDSLVGRAGPDGLFGGDGNDLIYEVFEAFSDDLMVGGAGNDLMIGGRGNDALYGDEGHDSMHGGEGNDFLYGHTGADYLDGGAGEDFIGGNGHGQILYGASGRDTFWIVSTANDCTIMDFTSDEQIQLYNSPFASFSELMSSAYESGNDTVIAKGGFRLILNDISLSSLAADDFAFV